MEETDPAETAGSASRSPTDPPSFMSTAPQTVSLPKVLLNADSLPSLPAVAVEVLRLTGEEGTTLDDLADTIAKDPALAAKLLKLSNSSLFTMGQEVTSLQKATMVLGMKSVMLMALSFSLSDSVPKTGANGLFDYNDYWYRSLVGAVAGRSLAQLVGRPELADEAFLCGLLANFGGLVMVECLPDDYSAVLAAADGNWPTADLEDQLMGFNQSDVTMALLDSWSIPSLLSKAVGYMQRPQKLPRGLETDVRELTAIMTLVALTVRVMCDRDKGRHLRTLQKWAGSKYGLGKDRVDEYLNNLKIGIKETADMLQIELPAGHSHEDVLRIAREHLLAISLGTAIDLTRSEEAKQNLEVERVELKIAATTDRLSGLPNRASLDEILATEIQTRLGRKKPLLLGVIMIDIDHFKKFNDTWGHAAGDEVLKVVAKAIQGAIQSSDTAARYGGEEFTVILPMTTHEDLRVVAERVRARVESAVCEWQGETLRVTISLGCATLAAATSPEDGDRLIVAADKKLYAAKEAGRNRVAV